MRRQTREVRVEYAPRAHALSTGLVRQAVVAVLDGESTGPARISVTFLSGQRMRGLNRRTFGQDQATDVIAFGLPHPGRVVGDVYLCPSVARRTARELQVPEREELLRLVVHGTLHVLGYEHPDGEQRTVSLMWRLQERYVRWLAKGTE